MGRLGYLAMLFLLLSGCAPSVQVPGDDRLEGRQGVPAATQPAAAPEGQPAPPEAPKGAPALQGGTEKLPNQTYSWWFRRGYNHEPSTFDGAILTLLEKYDAIAIGSPDEKTLYLTFDEGYEQGYTGVILDTLKKHQVQGAFFITQDYLDKEPELVQRMVAEGHLVGNHTVTHPSLPSLSNDGIIGELKGLEDDYYRLTGKNMHYFRPPMGEYSERVLSVASQMGYRAVFWSFAYRDWEVDKQKGADYAYKTVMEQLHPGAVLLLHAVSKDNAEALDRIIRDAKEQGYTFQRVDRL